MIELRDKQSGMLLGTVTEEELQFLVRELEETDARDADYYVDTATIEMLEEDGAPRSLVDLLRRSLAGRDGMEVRWTRR
jgi:processive 1,2-diacylglycerol beta-glucosyltransferase